MKDTRAHPARSKGWQESLRDSARLYASRGVRVLKLTYPRPGGNCSCGDPTHRVDVPRTRCGKHSNAGKNWQKQATSDPGTVRHRFTDEPNANVGQLLSAEVGHTATDVDSAEGDGVTPETPGVRVAMRPRTPAGPVVRTPPDGLGRAPPRF